MLERVFKIVFYLFNDLYYGSYQHPLGPEVKVNNLEFSRGQDYNFNLRRAIFHFNVMNNKLNVVYCTVGGSKTLIDCHTSNNGIDMNGIYMNIELLSYSEKEMLKDKNWVQS